MPRSVCGDEHRLFYPQMTVCYASMEQAGAQAKWERLHADKPWHDGTFTSWAAEPSGDHPYHHSHGVTIWVSQEDLDPERDFLSASVGR